MARCWFSTWLKARVRTSQASYPLSVPIPLCKFGSAKAVATILKSRSLFITSPLDLNDPFEMRPAWTNDHQALFDRERDRWADILEGCPTVTLTKEGIVPGGRMPAGAMRTPKTTKVENQRGLADTFNSQVFAAFHQRFRVLSLTRPLFKLAEGGGESNETDTLLWSHYGDHFQGACLIVDTERLHGGYAGKPVPVNYDRKRQSLPVEQYSLDAQLRMIGTRWPTDPASGLRLPPEVLDARITQRYIEVLTRKSPAWQYEQEERLIYSLATMTEGTDYHLVQLPCQVCGTTTPHCPHPCHRETIHFPPDAVLGVVFGSDCPRPYGELIFEALRDSAYRHVRLFWSALASDQYAVQYTEASSEDSAAMLTAHTEHIALAKEHCWLDEGNRLICTPHAAVKGVNYQKPRPTKR